MYVRQARPALARLAALRRSSLKSNHAIQLSRKPCQLDLSTARAVVKESLTTHMATTDARLTVLKSSCNRYSSGTLTRSGHLRKITLTYCHVNTFSFSGLR